MTREHNTVVIIRMRHNQAVEQIKSFFVERRALHSMTCSQCQLQALTPTPVTVECFRCGLYRLASFDQFYIAVRGTNVPPTAARIVRMSSATETPVVILIPVEEVVN